MFRCNILFFLFLFFNSLHAFELSKDTDRPVIQKQAYQFNLRHIHDNSKEATGLIEYVADGQLLYSEKFILEKGDKTANIVYIPDVVALSVAFDDADISIDVYVGDALVDQMTMNEFINTQKQFVDALSVNENKACSGIDCIVITCDPTVNLDCDSDGVPNTSDNCPLKQNTNQVDCDSDGYGDVCDSQNGVFYQVDAGKTCLIDKDRHVWNFDLEHYIEKTLVDVSACNSPNRYTKSMELKRSCGLNVSNKSCCLDKLSDSIISFGDIPSYWCDRIDDNQCH